MPLFLMDGCAGGSPGTPRVDDPSPWSWDGAATAPTPYDADAVAAGIEAALPRVRSVDVRPAFDAAVAYVEAGDVVCPTLATINGLTYVEGNCAATGGVVYHGWVQYAAIGGLYMDDGWWHDDYRWMTGTFRVELADGTMLAHEGDLRYTTWRDETGLPVWDATASGDFHWRGPGAPDSWLAEDVAVMLRVTYHHAGAAVDGGPWVAADGEMARLGGTFDAVSLDAFVYPGAACAIEPEGRIEVHDDQGLWYTVQFGGACDGCGDVASGTTGEPLGSACPDLSALRTWGVDPWSP